MNNLQPSSFKSYGIPVTSLKIEKFDSRNLRVHGVIEIRGHITRIDMCFAEKRFDKDFLEYRLEVIKKHLFDLLSQEANEGVYFNELITRPEDYQ